MLRALRVDRAGHWPCAERRGSVTLSYDDRHRRRIALRSDQGEDFVLDLPRAMVLETGDGLACAEGGWIEVQAAPEPLLEIRAASAELLCRLAWHIGNRHLMAEIHADRIRLRNDHVIAAMLEGLGAAVTRIDAPFNPERGAYTDAANAHHHHDQARHDE
jgi:urease accessory protein